MVQSNLAGHPDV